MIARGRRAQALRRDTARRCRVGNDCLSSGEWWITILCGAVLVLIALS
jgi:hypothetical protein